MTKPARPRLDQLLVDCGLAPTRSAARALVMAGLVEVGGKMIDKAGTPVPPDAELHVKERPRFVSRAGEKLAHALDVFALDIRGARALDVGASTGGFVDCLLQSGAAEVIALDVGYGQLDGRLRQDPRVHVLERINARYLLRQQLPYEADLLTVDVSFIGLEKILPSVLDCVAPQFDRPAPGQTPVRGRPHPGRQGGRGARPARPSRRAPEGSPHTDPRPRARRQGTDGFRPTRHERQHRVRRPRHPRWRSRPLACYPGTVGGATDWGRPRRIGRTGFHPAWKAVRPVGLISRIALVTHQVPSVAGDALQEVMLVLRRREIEVLLPPGETAKHPDLLSEGVRPCCEVAREELAAADLCLVLGGDGTMLRALRLTRDLGLPVAGLNLGRVGFFTAIERDHVVDDLDRILDGEFVAHPLMGLATSLNGTGLRAVNDIVLARHREGGICRLSYSLNGVTLFDVRCDGLIVATPAGSSAYNLAAGGPLLGIDLDAYVLTFLAPHALIAPAGGGRGAGSSGGAQRDRLTTAWTSCSTASTWARSTRSARWRSPPCPSLATLALLPESDFYRHFRERFV